MTVLKLSNKSNKILILVSAFLMTVCLILTSLALASPLKASAANTSSQTSSSSQTNSNGKSAYSTQPSDYVFYTSASGYKVIIQDEVGLLSESEKLALIDVMKPIADQYGNACFVSTNSNTSISTYTKEYLKNTFGLNESSTLFVINMYQRELYLGNSGDLSKVVTSSYSLAITDNVYHKATKTQYYDCIVDVFNQEYNLLDKGKISQPMKYISNLIFSIILAMLLCYFYVMKTSKASLPTKNEVLASLIYSHPNDQLVRTFISQKRVYNPPKSSSSSGSSGSSGGGSFSGGGHSF